MKYRIRFFIVLLLLTTVQLLSGQDERYSFHYPLNPGDFWEYIFHGAFIHTRRVVGDTLLPDSTRYMSIEETLYSWTDMVYERVVDSSEVRLWDFNYPRDEFTILKLDLKVGDTWPWVQYGKVDSIYYYQVVAMGDTTVFSKKRKYAMIESFYLPDSVEFSGYSDYILVDSIGIYREGWHGGYYSLQGAIIDNEQYGLITSVQSPRNQIDSMDDLSVQNFPNPFNNSTTLEYRLKQSANVRIVIYNVLGERIQTLVDEYHSEGVQRVTWSGNHELGFSVASGTYIAVVEIDGLAYIRKKMLLLK